MAEMMGNFEVESKVESNTLNATVYSLVHTRNRARVIAVINDDKNLMTCPTFNSYISNDKGMPHILEHSIGNSTKKYPGNSVFFNVIYSTPVTYANAYTMPAATAYGMTTSAQAQLEVLTDYLLDCMFHSDILTNEDIFKREGWRYTLDNPQGELGVTGVVYSEMQTVMGQPMAALYDHSARMALKGTPLAFEAGGLPEAIRDLSYGELVDFVKENYNPGNMTLFFYGAIDLPALLDVVESNIGDLDGHAITVDLTYEAPDTSSKVFDFPVGATVEDKGNQLFFAKGLTPYPALRDGAILELMCAAINAGYGGYLKRVQEAGFDANELFDLSEMTADTLLLAASFPGEDPSRAEELRLLLNSILADLRTHGVDAEIIKELAQTQEMTSLLWNTSGVFNGFAGLVGSYYTYRDLSIFDQGALFADLRESFTTQAGIDALDRLFEGAGSSVVVGQKNAPGLLEVRQAELKAQLSAKKETFTDKEIDALIADTKRINASSTEVTPQSTIDKLNAVAPHELGDVEMVFDEHDESIGGVRVLSACFDTELVECSYQFALDGLSVREVVLADMVAGGLGLFDSSKRSRDEIHWDTTRLLGKYQAFANATLGTPMLSVEFNCLAQNAQAACDLVIEGLTTSDYRANVGAFKQYMTMIASSMVDGSFYMQRHGLYTLGTFGNEDADKNWQLLGQPYVEQYADISQALENDIEGLISEIERVNKKLYVAENATVMYAGSVIAQKEITKKLVDVLACGQRQKFISLLKDDLQYTGALGVATTSNLAFGNNEIASDPRSFAIQKLGAQVLTEQFMYKKFRFEGGSYTAQIARTGHGLVVILFRSPDMSFLMDHIPEIPQALEELVIRDEQLNAYKLNSISSMISSRSDLEKAKSCTARRFGGKPFGFYNEVAREIAHVTLEDIKGLLVDDLRGAVESGRYWAIGTQQAFDSVPDTFGL